MGTAGHDHQSLGDIEHKHLLHSRTTHMRPVDFLMEELQAVDRDNQRVDACSDSKLEAILTHNRDTYESARRCH
jgi:hypothetical protein